jgi:hypothetical protein
VESCPVFVLTKLFLDGGGQVKARIAGVTFDVLEAESYRDKDVTNDFESFTVQGDARLSRNRKKSAGPGTAVGLSSIRNIAMESSLPVRGSMHEVPPETRLPDKVAKVFRVEQPWRRCLVCDKLFTPEAARAHANVPCRASPQNSLNETRALRGSSTEVANCRNWNASHSQVQSKAHCARKKEN